jgi:predicted DNA-binding helix-hairpin-helix protein
MGICHAYASDGRYIPLLKAVGRNNIWGYIYVAKAKFSAQMSDVEEELARARDQSREFCAQDGGELPIVAPPDTCGR